MVFQNNNVKPLLWDVFQFLRSAYLKLKILQTHASYEPMICIAVIISS